MTWRIGKTRTDRRAFYQDVEPMLEIAQFRNKIKTHGLPLTLAYSAEFMVRPVWRKIWVEPRLKSYSQRYEDLIIDEILGHKQKGVYLDIGAYDPHALSNTKRFYDRGWRGCNIEPNPKRFKRFIRERPRDINLNIGVSESAGKLTFFDVAQEALATFSEQRAKELKQMGAKIREEIEIPVLTMSDIFREYLKGEPVDFCTIDTEGMDLKILRGNDWNRFRPQVLCVEISLDHEEGSIAEFLKSVGYGKHSETVDFGVPLNEIYVTEY